MTNRNHYLPSARALEAMSDQDRAFALVQHLRDLEDEIQGIKEGRIYGRGGKHYLLKLANARMRRLVKAANAYGLWMEDNQQAA